MKHDDSLAIQQRYNEVPYFSFPYPLSAPEHLAAVARVFGIETPDVGSARVLELGCASGGNLIPFAVRNPRAHAVGLDLSGAQVKAGLKRIERLSLKNIELREEDLTTLTGQSGRFDYILCHGVYSWVPEFVQQAILRICRENLSPNGIAYIGYKTYPGWKAHDIVRDAMLLRAGASQSQQHRLSLGRGVIDFLATHARPDSVLSRAIAQDHNLIRTADDAYTIHDYLTPFNAPCYFRDFVARVESNELAYVADAEPAAMFAPNYGDDVARALRAECGDNRILLEQYFDFVSDRSFRRSLLVKQALAESISWHFDEQQLRKLHVAALLSCADGDAQLDDTPRRYVSPEGNTAILDGRLIKIAARALAQCWPFTLSFTELCEAVQQHTGDASQADLDVIQAQVTHLIRQIVSGGVGRYRVAPLKRVTQNPHVDPVARAYPAELPAGQALHTFNAWHEPVVLGSVGRTVLPLLDGTFTRDELLAKLADSDCQHEFAERFGNDREAMHRQMADELDRVLIQLCA